MNPEDKMWEDEDYDALDAYYDAQDKLEAATMALYDQDEEKLGPAIEHLSQPEVMGHTLSLSIWESQLTKPDYYDWFLAEVAL